jgi:hypothetical protein
MITRSNDYVEYCRETARHARDLHDLALRGRHNKETTRRIHEQIAAAVGLGAGDDLVDIGCGDGTLLLPGTAQSFSATPEEFVAMAADAGLECVRYWRHENPNTRNNYLFRKPEAA